MKALSIRKNTLALLALVALALFGAMGCKKKVGQKCSGTAGYCTPEGELFCGGDGTLHLMPCHGPQACKAVGTRVSCDTTNSLLGEGCNTPSDSYECSADKKAVLVCENEKWTAESTCKGVKGCRADKDGISCDSSVADATDDCHTNGNYACTPTKDMLLQCADGKFAPLVSCRGPAGCSSKEEFATKSRNFRCDTTLGQEGDVCETAEDYTCSVDKKSVLVCTANKWAVKAPCAGACSIDAKGNVSCNGVVAGHGGGGADRTAAAGAVSGKSAAKSGGADAGAPSTPAGGTKPDAGSAPASPADAGAKPTVADAGAKAPATVKDAGAAKPKKP